MKKILILMLCAILFCAMPIMASADEADIPESVETEETTPGTEEAPPVEEVPAEPEMTFSEKIVNLITTKYDSTALISLVFAIVAYTIYGINQFKTIGSKLGIFNNNVVKVAEDSSKAIDATFVEAKEMMKALSDGNSAALTEVLGKAEGIAEVVTTFSKVMETFIERIGDVETDKAATREALMEATKAMKACKEASLEESNIVAELLLLANIPNSKKEEIYARHLSAVNAIADAEKSEVATDDGKET